jgi:hypothetical protein
MIDLDPAVFNETEVFVPCGKTSVALKDERKPQTAGVPFGNRDQQLAVPAPPLLGFDA